MENAGGPAKLPVKITRRALVAPRERAEIWAGLKGLKGWTDQRWRLLTWLAVMDSGSAIIQHNLALAAVLRGCSGGAIGDARRRLVLALGDVAGATLMLMVWGSGWSDDDRLRRLTAQVRRLEIIAPGSAGTLIERARLAYRMRKYDEAIVVFLRFPVAAMTDGVTTYAYLAAARADGKTWSAAWLRRRMPALSRHPPEFLMTEPYRDIHMPYLASTGFQKLCYREWGAAENPRVVMCVHGLSRNRRDFDALAAVLAEDYRVLAVDMPGRGDSDWLAAATDYNYPFFQTLLAALIAVSGAATVDWVGTSMGGILGMALASQPGSPIRRLVLNDVGPFISGASRAANTNVTAATTVWPDEETAIAAVLEYRKAFGPFTPAAARKFARDSLVASADGGWRLHFDPRIMTGRDTSDADMWAAWTRIDVPVLCLWGMESILLSAATVERMRATGPRAEVYALAGVGHCPGLTSGAEIARIQAFLEGPGLTA